MMGASELQIKIFLLFYLSNFGLIFHHKIASYSIMRPLLNIIRVKGLKSVLLDQIL